MSMPDWHTVLVIVGLTLVTVLARGFFLISDKAWTLPHWVQRALQYAPIAALAAVVVGGIGAPKKRPGHRERGSPPHAPHE
ncbi:MAG: AzlD domain-containing protein, partial [Rhodoferax sp.]|nr:AzlD domain-containing protein [Rhodoferax sp.]